MKRFFLLASSALFAACGGSHTLPPDSGTSNPDTGPPPQTSTVDDQCGAASPATVLTDTRRNIPIDTTELTSTIVSTCGGAATIGNDGFLAVDMQAGDAWHFHVKNDPTDPASVDRNPGIYLMSAACDERDCSHVSLSCSDGGDEHFTMVADADGRYFLGIDDGVSGGGRYLLDAIRLVCGDGTEVHGEACDDGNLDDGDGCDHRCQREITVDNPEEREANDDIVSANALVLPDTGELIVSGAIGGPGTCLYGDYFSLDVPEGATIEVDVVDADGAVCSSGALTPFDLSLADAAGELVVNAQTDASGCSQIRASALPGGHYTIEVGLGAETDTVILYRLRVRVTP